MTSRKEFIEFIESLRKSLIEKPDQWENRTLEDYLEALSRYTEDIPGYYVNTNQDINADEPSWKVFSDILKGASLYE